MSDLATYLHKRAHAINSERLLFSEDGVTIAATGALGMAHFYEISEKQEYREWEKEFSESFGERFMEFEERRVEQLLNPDEIPDTLRNDDVSARWEFEQFFAEEGNEGAKRVLGYYHYEDGETVYNQYTDDQFEQLIDEGIVEAEGESLHGHHILDVSSHAADQEVIHELYHADNIRLMTREAHFQDPDLGHGGDWSNSTTGETDQVISRYEDIKEVNRDIVDESIAAFNLYAGVGVGAVVGVISAVVDIYKNRNNPHPRRKGAAMIAVTSLIRGAEAGTLSLIALNIRSSVSNIGESKLLETKVEFANNVLTTVIPGNFESAMEAGNTAMYAGFSTSIASLRIIRSGMVSIAIWRKYNRKLAGQQFSKDSKVILAEESVFLGGAFLMDMIIDVGEDALIPDPTFGILIAARMSWSGIKKFNQSVEERKAIEKCKQKKLDGLYESSVAALVYLG